MDAKLKEWRQAGRHLPAILRDFHDQKEVFRAMHELTLRPKGEIGVSREINWVEGQIYVIDMFLWFMARHGYTLQRSRAAQNFESLEQNLALLAKQRTEQFAQFLQATKASPPDPSGTSAT